jgi:ribosomal protein S18 acetylase RimI-like enzyme
MSADPIEIRVLGLEDLSVFEHVDPDVFDHAVQPALAERYLSTPGNLLAVALQERVVVGMASGITYVHPDKPLQLFVNEVGVAGTCRGKGIGKRLVLALLERGRELGCIEAWVATEVENAPARALYRSLEGVEDRNHAVVYTWRLAVREESGGIRV